MKATGEHGGEGGGSNKKKPLLCAFQKRDTVLDFIKDYSQDIYSTLL